jgi:hypothetical protein
MEDVDLVATMHLNGMAQTIRVGRSVSKTGAHRQRGVKPIGCGCLQ